MTELEALDLVGTLRGVLSVLDKAQDHYDAGVPMAGEAYLDTARAALRRMHDKAEQQRLRYLPHPDAVVVRDTLGNVVDTDPTLAALVEQALERGRDPRTAKGNGMTDNIRFALDNAQIDIRQVIECLNDDNAIEAIFYAHAVVGCLDRLERLMGGPVTDAGPYEPPSRQDSLDHSQGLTLARRGIAAA